MLGQAIMVLRPVIRTSATTCRAIHYAKITRSPTGQHMAASGEELKSEHDKQMKSGNKDLNEKLATHSEAGIRAEKDTRSAAALQKDTVKEASSNRSRD
ncbi:hypothetical protein MJO28_009950 [Puccinia striiformis f. sp. tritici]|uniref:Uncharacterized protein n=3 Tax=Puccinia striiformis TaxID=27350 RepID=A0A0L0UT40_9BASI|nr:hypothetical protein Pst134EA_017226 [Puccinia striiformis f. sp. tritici]KAI9622185.1 hypothetical protein H4Q26_015219 [Puccinia striiformis f. sp. tritici PST-130]KNE90086.1 hypothetical protein PSTG_16463 [Puccinia striiformis f. sp. tritici PST-78]POW00540.1 hypothetical protein PSTT_13090 [Puccinia striiformis]KAH9450623.1 hypothetical protein Pst134EB_018153 [Puccinia striiformis f. sp. tritici]KAH9460914.1 hypothetical protein Pst134EA_017226 [Puccinia striiformis f. sp. tritici]